MRFRVVQRHPVGHALAVRPGRPQHAPRQAIAVDQMDDVGLYAEQALPDLPAGPRVQHPAQRRAVTGAGVEAMQHERTRRSLVVAGHEQVQVGVPAQRLGQRIDVLRHLQTALQGDERNAHA